MNKNLQIILTYGERKTNEIKTYKTPFNSIKTRNVIIEFLFFRTKSERNIEKIKYETKQFFKTLQNKLHIKEQNKKIIKYIYKIVKI